MLVVETNFTVPSQWPSRNLRILIITSSRCMRQINQTNESKNCRRKHFATEADTGKSRRLLHTIHSRNQVLPISRRQLIKERELLRQRS